jgi:dGTPase
MVEHSERAGDIVQGPEAGPAMSALRDFMFERVYLGPAVRAEHVRIANVVRRLFEHYVEHPELLPATERTGAGAAREQTVAVAAGESHAAPAADVDPAPHVDLPQRVTDYLAGMTDRYCIREYTELQVPRAFAR